MAFSLVFSLVVIELVLRHSSIAAKIAPERFLFLDAPQNFRDQHNEFGYSAYSRTREVAIYSDRRNAWIEYDASFTTNNAGLVQRKDIDRSKEYVVIVGDSFTQGQGASPWFYKLEEILPALPLANLGVVGTGVQHWEKAVDWFNGRVAKVEKVGVIFISADFSRPYWHARSSPEKTDFCYEKGCSTVFTKLLDAYPAALAEYRRELLKKQRPPQDDADSLKAGISTLLTKTQTGAVLIALVSRRHMGKPPPIHLEANKRSLQALRTRHKVVFALHLPEKAEASAGTWSTVSLEIKDFIAMTGIPYVDGLEQCRLGDVDFREFDAHPNVDGYQKIQRCVSELLKATIS